MGHPIARTTNVLVDLYRLPRTKGQLSPRSTRLKDLMLSGVGRDSKYLSRIRYVGSEVD